MDDILELCGNNLKNEIKTFRDSEILTSHRKIVIAELNKFKEKHKTNLFDIRHNVIGHRHHDMLTQLNHISEIKWVDSISLISEYDQILAKLGHLCQTLINHSIDEVHRETN
jgi:hypothetical protein